jgi:endonuclease YncB( thermonuclease family)
MPAWLSPGYAFRRGSPLLRRGLRPLLVIGLFALAAFVAARLDPLPPRFTGEARAADGDSLRVGSDRVRLLGIDAPELDQICWTGEGAEWPCGRDAREAMTALLEAGSISCRTEGADKYGRFLARCEVGGVDIAEAIVRQGFAIATEGYGGAEAAARNAKRGIWQGRFTPPRQWRDEGPTAEPAEGILDQAWNWFRELTGARSLR